MIDLELYRIFYVVAKTKNITKASEELHISQPAVTKHIKNLESLLGLPLFIRTNKGVILTEYGEKIYLNVKQALILLEECEDLAKDFIGLSKGTIKLGTSTAFMRCYLLKYLELFHNKFPNIIIDIYTDPTKDLINKLKKGELDLIIGKFPYEEDKELDYLELGKTKYIFVFNKKYYAIKNAPLKLKNIKEPILLQEYPSNSRISFENYCRKNNITLKPKMNIASSNLLVDFIKMGYGIGYVTELYVKNYLDNGALTKVNILPEFEEITYGVISLKNNIVSKPCQEFINFFK